jgi:hypothetical protein
MFHGTAKRVAPYLQNSMGLVQVSKYVNPTAQVQLFSRYVGEVLQMPSEMPSVLGSWPISRMPLPVDTCTDVTKEPVRLAGW